MQLFEKYRPATWDEVLGQDKIVKRLRKMSETCGLVGQVYWLSGKSGQGKTTIAKLIAAEVADPFNVQEFDGSKLTPAGVDEMERNMRLHGMPFTTGKTGRAYIINEAHRLRPDVITRLEVLCEPMPEHCVIIFTTTVEGQLEFFDKLDAKPFLSRCIKFSLAQRGICELFAQRVHEIATEEGLNGQPVSEYEKLAKRCRNNMREMLQAVQACEMLTE